MSIEQKAKEIAAALLQVAKYIRRQYLGNRIERLAFRLADRVVAANFKSGLKTLASLLVLVELGKQVNEIDKNNALILMAEINRLNTAIRQTMDLDAANSAMPNLESLFSKLPITISATNPANVANDSATTLPGIVQDSANNISNGNGITATIRQSAILDKIRQSGNLQLKDLIAAFPEVSERTMRYDLQRLGAQGLIERIGGGPASQYVIK